MTGTLPTFFLYDQVTEGKKKRRAKPFFLFPLMSPHQITGKFFPSSERLFLILSFPLSFTDLLVFQHMLICYSQDGNFLDQMPWLVPHQYVLVIQRNLFDYLEQCVH